MRAKDVERVAKAERKLRKVVESIGCDYVDMVVREGYTFLYVSPADDDRDVDCYIVENGDVEHV